MYWRMCPLPITQKVFVLLGVCVELFKLIQGVSLLLMNPICVQAISVFLILPLLLSSGIPWNTWNTSLFLILTSFPGIYCAVVCEIGIAACLCFAKLYIQSWGVHFNWLCWVGFMIALVCDDCLESLKVQNTSAILYSVWCGPLPP